MRTATPTSSRRTSPGSGRRVERDDRAARGGPSQASESAASGDRVRRSRGRRTERTPRGLRVDGDLDRLEAGDRQRAVPRQVDGERSRPSPPTGRRAAPCPRSSSCASPPCALPRARSAGPTWSRVTLERVGVGAVEQLVTAPLAQDGAGVARVVQCPEPGAVRLADRLDVGVPELGVRVPDQRAARAPSRPAPCGRSGRARRRPARVSGLLVRDARATTAERRADARADRQRPPPRCGGRSATASSARP